MVTVAEMRLIAGACTYKPGWKIHLCGLEGIGDRPFVQIEVTVESDASLDSASRDGMRSPWKSGKRFLSSHMCRQEIVGVIFGVIKDAEMHEVHEWFRYRGASIYNPHLDPDILAAVACKASSFITRENAMTMTESGGA